MKKICFIVTDAISFNLLYRDQLEYICDNTNYSLTLICGGNLEEIKKLRSRDVGIVINLGFKRKPSLISDLISFLRLYYFLIFHRFDLIVYSTPKALLLGSVASVLSLQKKRIAMIRGRVYENFAGINRLLFSTLDKICLYLSTDVLFISNSLKKLYIEEKLVHFRKATILGNGSSNGVDTTRFIPSTNKNEVFTIVMVGRVCLDKGIKDLEQILKKIKNTNIKIEIFGSVENDHAQDILDNILYKYPFVKYYGQSDNIECIFKKAHLHLFLTHREGFGNVAIEAASCGVPTFAYDVVGVRDSVKDGVSGKCFEFGKYDQIAAAIDNASSNSGHLNKYHKARDWAIQNFEQQAVWYRYLEFYNEHITS